MKRTCNANERKLLLKNQNQILKGMLKASAKGKYANIFIGLFFSFVVMIAGIFPLVEIFDGSDVAMWIWFAFSFTVPNMIVSKIMTGMRMKKEAKAFLKKENLMINGATIVRVDAINGSIAYIEDDFLNSDGTPIIIDYPALASELKMEDEGKRLIVMYDGDASFQLMRVNDELHSLIPTYSEHYPLTKELSEYKRVPHPNASSIPFCGHVLSDKEKKYISELYMFCTWGSTKKILTICSCIIIPIVFFLSIVLNVTEGNSIINGILIGLAVNVGIFAFFFLMRQLGKKNHSKICNRFTYVQEVILHSFEYKQRGQTVSLSISVYEWKNNHFELSTYNNTSVDLKISYGDVLYKLTNDKGAITFIPKKTIDKMTHKPVMS